MSVLDITTSFEFSVIKKPSKCIASVPHMKSGGIPIFNQHSGFGLNVTGASSQLQDCCWSLACGTKLLAPMLCQMRNSVESSHFK